MSENEEEARVVDLIEAREAEEHQHWPLDGLRDLLRDHYRLVDGEWIFV